MYTRNKSIDPKKLKLIWISMLASIIIYAGFGFFYLTQIPARSHFLQPDVLAKVRLVLYLISLVLLFASIKLCRRAHSRIAMVTRDAFPQSIGDIQPPNPVPDPFSGSSTSPDRLASAYPLLMVSWALSESIAIFGLVLVFLGGHPPDLYGFSLAAFFLLIINRPKIPSSNIDASSGITPS